MAKDAGMGVLHVNGNSLSSLAGASVSAKTQVEIRFPASSLAEALHTIHRLGRTGKLEVNFHQGKALDMKWLSSRQTDPPDV